MITDKVPIKEVFSSFQGEGIFLGVRQIFVRFAQCNLNCSFCDEKIKIVKYSLSINQLIKRIHTLEKKSGPHHSISFTGGEPLLYKDYLNQLFPRLKKNFKIYLETNGTLFNSLKALINFFDFISMDIKLPSSTEQRDFFKDHIKFLKIARKKNIFVKTVVTKNTLMKDFKKAVEIIEEVNKDIPFIIQPVTAKDNMDLKKLFTFYTIAKASLSDVRIIPQIHRFLGIK